MRILLVAVRGGTDGTPEFDKFAIFRIRAAPAADIFRLRLFRCRARRFLVTLMTGRGRIDHQFLSGGRISCLRREHLGRLLFRRGVRFGSRFFKDCVCLLSFDIATLFQRASDRIEKVIPVDISSQWVNRVSRFCLLFQPVALLVL